MSINELLNELCPDGVEFVKIGEVAKVGTGSSNRQDAVDNGKYPFYVRSKNILTSDTYEFDDESIIIPGEGGVGEIFHYVKGKYALHQRVYRINFYDERINAKFVYYYMHSCFKRFIMKKAVSSTVTSIRKPMIEKFEIPLPPIEIQTKIVQVLDQFEKLTAELKCRKLQYNYYRNKLLTFDEKDVKFVKLGDCCEYIRGITYNKSKEENNKDIPAWNVLRANNITLSNNQLNFDDVKRVSKEVKVKDTQKLKKGDILICAGSGSKDHIGKVAYVSDDLDYTFGGFMAVIRSSAVNTRFLFHTLTGSSFRRYLNSTINSTTINNLNSSVMENFKFPLPPIETQTKIATILDQFETLTTSLQSGIPAEIEARRKQYEYYRNKLLTFKRKE